MPPNEAAWIDCTAVPSQTNHAAMSGRAVVIGKGLVIEVHFDDSPHVAQGPESTGSARVISARSLTSIHIAGQDYGTYQATTYEDPGYVTLTFGVANATVLLPVGTGPTDIGQMLDAIRTEAGWS